MRQESKADKKNSKQKIKIERKRTDSNNWDKKDNRRQIDREKTKFKLN